VQVRGYVKVLNAKLGRRAGRTWTAYSLKVVSEETGEELKPWFSFGFSLPPCRERDLVSFTADRSDAGYWNIVTKTFRNLER